MRITQRKQNGLYIVGAITIILIFWMLIGYQYESINYVLDIMKFGYQVRIEQVNYIASMVITILLLTTFIFWCFRNKIWQGKKAFKRYFLILNLRKEMIEANYQEGRHVTKHVLRLPKIRIVFDNKEMSSGKLMIRDSIEFHERLKKATFTPALRKYKVETFYLTDDGNYWVYEFISVQFQIQSTFDTLESFLSWSKETSNNYQLRIDKRLTFDLKHTLLVGATRTGKTYGLIGLLLQMLHKSINYQLFFADPKNDQLRKIGNWVNPKKTAFKKEDLIAMVENVHNRLIEREQEMAEVTLNRLTGDYRDVNLEPIFLVFDEFSSFISELDNKGKKDVLGKLTSIVQRGAGAGVFLFIIMQKSDAHTLPTAIRSNLLLKIVLGNADPTTYTTAFESSSEIPAFNYQKGQGVYLDDTMKVPRLVSFPYLRFLDEYNNGNKDPASLWKRQL